MAELLRRRCPELLNLGNGVSLVLLLGTVVACLDMAPVYLSLEEKMRYHPNLPGQYRAGIFQLGQLLGSVVDVTGLCFGSLVWIWHGT